jgi:ubiquinone biosynthesis protein UbiJ
MSEYNKMNRAERQELIDLQRRVSERLYEDELLKRRDELDEFLAETDRIRKERESDG